MVHNRGLSERNAAKGISNQWVRQGEKLGAPIVCLTEEIFRAPSFSPYLSY